VAPRHGAVPERARAQEVQLAIAAHPAEVDLGFWRAVLGYDAAADDSAVDPLGHRSTVWMQDLDETKPLRHAMHVDVSVAREHAGARLAAALAAGGRMVDDSHAPEYWVLADRAGNRVCIVAWPDGASATPAADPDTTGTVYAAVWPRRRSAAAARLGGGARPGRSAGARPRWSRRCAPAA
jgi:4a-hydroxytetrahydrobiopterin dehydratase